MRAFDKREGNGGKTDLEMDDLRAVIQQTVPLARMRAEEIRQMRDWAAEHAIAASSRPTTAPIESPVATGRVLSI